MSALESAASGNYEIVLTVGCIFRLGLVFGPYP
ncbi:hypothetical protein J2855_000104 [Agrobacterium tumefaciens]|jgi:hypothetical protein|uniref:Uncharacterized protein n=2 Tax=Agrobacterium tumefaciens complex TaxID=1183400 RepID=A0AAW8LRP0_AGRTU|nr:hypothetical protein At1D1460_12910 [Agrobacterium tumefaciens]MBB4280478.1 hypothetical protein [Agrobacterium radiobacter]MCP2134618.1 hypothetical protein [Rhizobium sp. SLBN-94]SNB59625.1 hypothetical protein SAMN05661103_1616 [Agrobacterium sp. 719_389]AYM81233.1 hypothetical protein At12D1_13460 [Agrobacterium tumefaciens]